MRRQLQAGAVLCALALLFAAATGVRAQGVRVPPRLRPVSTAAPTMPAPAGFATLAPLATPTPAGPQNAQVPTGTRVPLSKLAPLPPQTAANTVRPSKAGRVRILDATGATITITTDQYDDDCDNTSGAVFSLNCTIEWQSTGLPDNRDRYQDYYVSATTSSDYTATATAAGEPYQVFFGFGGEQHDTSLNATGTWIFGTYDTTENEWITVVYVNVGQAFDVQVYQDAAHTQEAYQFDAASGNDAYILVSNVTPTDKYVVYVEQTSLNPSCVYVSPAQSTQAAAGQLCDPALSPGITAPGGSLSVTWPLSSADSAGVYSIVVYDLTANQRLGQVQVGLIGANNTTLLVAPDGTGAGINPSPNPVADDPPVSPAPESYVAWDGNGDDSTTGVSLNVTGLARHSYTWSVSDPDGEVLGTSTSTFSAATGTYASHVFNFTTMGVLGPGYYPSPTFTASLYDADQNFVVASTTFKIVGYYSTTEFTTGSGTSQTLNIATSPTTAALVLANGGATRYGTEYSDSFSGLEFSTGTNFTVTGGIAAGDGYGVTAVPNGMTLAQCQVSGGCSTTVTDSNGGAWDVTDWCSPTATNAEQADAQCVLLFKPVSISTVLQAGASITLGGVSFAFTARTTCGDACSGVTAELPTHGLAWSSTAAATDNVSYAPFYFSTGAGYSGTASVALYGTEVDNGYFVTNTHYGDQAEEHYFVTRTPQAAYDRDDPYDRDNTYYDIYAFTITNDSSQTITEIALGLPGSYESTSELNNYVSDGNLNDNWAIDNNCQDAVETFGSKYVCFRATGRGIAKNATQTIYLSANAPMSSFPYTDWTVFAAAPVVFQMTPTGTATIPVGASNPYTVDNLAFGMYSLDGTLMSANFNPSAVGTNQQTVDIVFQNTSLAEDSNPDYVDAVVVQVPNGSVSGTPTIVTPGSGWSYLGTTGANPQYYWFGLCSGQVVSADGPPGVGIGNYPLTNIAASLPSCTAAQEYNALGPGGTLDVHLTLQNLATGENAFNLWAHGANGDGWSSEIPFSLESSSVSGTAGFSAIDGTAVAQNSEPTVSQDTNTYQYTMTIPDNSGAGNPSEFVITIPATDVNDLTATQLGASPWDVSSVSIASQSGVSGCTVGTIVQPNGATNGSITVQDCDFPNTGGSVTVQFSATSPSVQNDEWLFPATITTPHGMTSASETWAGDQRVKIADSIGLSVVIDPSNPGPGGSTPVVNCPDCAFAGSMIDFGDVNNNTQQAYADVARASVTAYSSAHSTWIVCVEANQNPASTYTGVAHELQAKTDSANSTSGLTYGDTSFTDVPVAGTGGTQLLIGEGPFSTSRTDPYDLIQSYQLSIGSEFASGTITQLTYTLIEDTSTCPST